MLIEFSVENFRSFKDLTVFSMVAASKLRSRDPEVDERNLIRVEGGPVLLSTAAIYGANASGKSNLIDALGTMNDLVLKSAEATKQTGNIPVDGHRLSMDTMDRPTRFELVFLVQDKQYRYGFCTTPERVVEEWLYWVPTSKEALLFHRNMDVYRLGRGFREGRAIIEKTRPNALFLSVVAQFNGLIASRITTWFSDRLNVVSGLHPESLTPYTLERYFEGEYKDQIAELIRKLDLGIVDLRVKSHSFTRDGLSTDAPDDLKKVQEEGRLTSRLTVTHRELMSVHPKFDSDAKVVGEEEFPFGMESDGTQKLFALAGMLVKTLAEGGILVVDELDSRLHPIMTRSLVSLFCSKETNSKGAQLVFTTQDTNMLDNTLLRRDQIWFTEKDRQGVSHLYSLAEFKEPVRNDANYERNYIRGRYGAVPFLGDLTSLWSGTDGEA